MQRIMIQTDDGRFLLIKADQLEIRIHRDSKREDPSNLYNRRLIPGEEIQFVITGITTQNIVECWTVDEAIREGQKALPEPQNQIKNPTK